MREINALKIKQHICIAIATFCLLITTICFGEKEPNSTDIEATEKVPIHPWHTGRVNNIQSESIEQLVENIANFDDRHFAITSINEGYSPNRMEHQIKYITNLFRVRRLFEEGINNPDKVIPILKQAYIQSHDSWLVARAERIKAKGGLTAPDEFAKVHTRAMASTYLLTEFDDHDSLELLLNGYKKQRSWIQEIDEEALTSVPVPTPMTLYAIHRLAVTLPENKMDSQTLAAKYAYLKWADKYIPEPEILKVTAWNADYDESDPYQRIVDPEGKVLIGQPSIYMPIYPCQLKDGTYFWRGHLDQEKQKENEWADLLIPFVEAAIK